MNETPDIDQTAEETDVGKAEVSGRTGWGTIPETIKELLSDPPVLPHESEDRFFELFESFRSYAEPENIVEYHLVYNAAVCKWETVRYRFMATAVTSNQQQAGLKSLFIETHNAASIPGAERSTRPKTPRGALPIPNIAKTLTVIWS